MSSINSLPLYLRPIIKNLDFVQNLPLDLKEIRVAILESMLYVNPEILSSKSAILPVNTPYNINLKWYPSDTEELFASHIENKDMQSLLNKLGWADDNGKPTEINYNLNQFGFRCKNITPECDKGILFLGCSHTFGVGLKEEQTFAKIVSNKLKRECYNFGMPGKGLDVSALYMSLFAKHEIDPDLIDAVVVYMPPPGRVSSFHYADKHLKLDPLHNDPLNGTKYFDDLKLNDMKNDKVMEMIDEFDINFDDDTEKMQVKLDAGLEEWVNKFRASALMHYNHTNENHFFRDVLSVNSIKLFCIENNIPLVVHGGVEAISTSTDLARDLSHYGPNTHKNIASEIISKLQILIE